jgi:hypothetical protein
VTASPLRHPRVEAPPAPADLSDESHALWPGFASDLAATWQNAERVSGVELVLLADVLRAMDRLRAIGHELAKAGPVVAGSRKQVRPHRLLRVEGELRGEVRRGFEKLGLSGWHTRNYRVDAAGRFVSRP